ncbi:amidohydrolase family protein [Niastella sp. OAS944]|uniref:amidohydrolase family protein n=1 Tax=Niastella sp. OAS944 TaxID=2664089 RepID=UPI003481A5CF|nr:Tol biopolymer transport system component [Chitinophagaceae bacterium OAS944]
MLYRIYGPMGVCFCLLNCLFAFAQTIKNGADVELYNDKKALSINSFTKDYSQLPIKPERTIKFTTNEGSYMNIDVSPNGKQLLFDLVGDIHLVSSKGGKTRQLTHGLGVKSKPVWSHDGKAFYYISDDNGELRMYKQSISGEIITMLSSSDISIKERTDLRSPNGRYFAYVRDTNNTKVLILYDSVKDCKKILISSLLSKPYSYTKYTILSQFAFSPDSKSIYIGYGGKIHQVFIQDGKNHIIPFSANVKSDLGAFVYNKFRISYDSFELKYMRSINRRADGKQLVFSGLGKVFVMDLLKGTPKLIAQQDAMQFQPIYSFDGQWIAYVTWNDKYGGQLWKVNSAGGPPEQLTKIPGHYQRPAWSPDGKWIAILRGKPTLNDRDEPGTGTLELIPTSDGEPIVIEDSVPLWNCISFSSDSKKVIFQPKFRTKDDHKNCDMLVAKSIDGSLLEVIAEGLEDRYIQQRTLSSDGKYLVYSAREDIYLLPIEAGKVLQLSTNNPQAIKIGPGVDPVWESNGRKLCWTYSNHFYSIDCEQIKKDEKSIKATEDIKLSFEVPSNYGKGVVAIKGARIITLKGKEVIEDGTILVKNGRIINIGKVDEVFIPEGITILDAKGKTIMPGIIDLHLHMRLSPDIFPQQSWMFLANLAYGVTTARDPSLNFDSFGYTELLHSGKMLGPRLYSVGRAARIGDGLIKLDNLEDARAFAKKRSALGGTVVKQYMLHDRRQKQLLLIACREAGLNMTNEGPLDPLDQIAMIKDGSTGIEHNPVWGEVYNDVLQLIAHSGVFFTPTIQVTLGPEEPAKEYFKYKFWRVPDDKMKQFIKSDSDRLFWSGSGAESLENIQNTVAKDTIGMTFLAPARINARMTKIGVKVGLGSHGNDQGIGAHNELWALQMGGLTNLEALRAATLTGAEALGIQEDVGSLEVSKIADLIILNKNPLDDIHNSREIQYIMKDGILYDGNTLNEVWPKKNKFLGFGR